MSANENSDYSGPQPSRRMFATEFNDVTYSFKESEEERAPNFSLMPTGEKANRAFFVGTLVEQPETVGDDGDVLRAKIIDPSGNPESDGGAATFWVYASGQYQPAAFAALNKMEAPEYVAIRGKPNTFENEDGDVYVSVRGESVTPVDKATRDQWVLDTAQQTLNRIEAFENLVGSDDADAHYINMAADQYGENVEKYRDAVRYALKDVRGDNNPMSGSSDEEEVEAEA